MSRGHVELIHAPAIASEPVVASGWPAGATRKVLSQDPQTGACTMVIELPAGWQRPAGRLSAEAELLLLGGSLRVGERSRGFGYYEYSPAAATQREWVTDTGCRLLLCARDRAPDFVAGENDAQGTSLSSAGLEIDTEAMPWMVSPVPGPPEGLLLKLLRHVEASGEMTFLCTCIPRYRYPMLEFHDCIEEVFMIEGDIWLGNSGTMAAGSYFWRPPFITHGPFYSREGCVMLGWVPSTLVNHVPLGPASSEDENLARYLAAGGERVLAPASRRDAPDTTTAGR